MAALTGMGMAMPDDDWFREPCLTGEAREQFENRLKRPRSSRAEYMRIQAHARLNAGAYQEALGLLDRTLAEFPRHLAAWLYQDRAECHQNLGQSDDAIRDYKHSMEAMRRGRGAVSEAPVRLARLVYEERRSDLYSECLSYLTEFWHVEPLFPQHELHQSGWAAILLHLLGRIGNARSYALRALDAAGKNRSKAAHHPSLGLAQASDQTLIRRLELIARGRAR